MVSYYYLPSTATPSVDDGRPVCLNRRRSDEFAVSDSSTQFSNKKSEGNTTILLRTVACVVAHPGSEFLLGGSSQTPFPVPSPLQKYILTLLRFTDEKFHTCQIVSDSSTRVYNLTTPVPKTRLVTAPATVHYTKINVCDQMTRTTSRHLWPKPDQ